MQTAALASGGLSNVFVSAYPALYQLKLLDTPASDYWRIVSLTAVGGYFGLFFATPLRKFFIIYVARELRLVFPSASATAMTIASMHDAVRGEGLGKLKMKALSWAFGTSMALRVVSQYAVGILWEWHFFTWFYIWSGYSNAAIAVENWGWYVQFTPAFIGSGMLVGLNVSISFFAGSVLAWGIIGPLLVHFNMAFGKLVEPGDPHWGEVVSFSSFSGKYSSKDTPSPRYWLLWPGVLAMMFISFTELALQWRVIFFAWKALIRAFMRWTASFAKATHRDIPWLNGKNTQEPEDMIPDPASPNQQVKMWMWLPGLIAVIIAMCLCLGFQYEMPLGMSLLSVFLAFFFSFLAIQCTGVTGKRFQCYRNQYAASNSIHRHHASNSRFKSLPNHPRRRNQVQRLEYPSQPNAQPPRRRARQHGGQPSHRSNARLPSRLPTGHATNTAVGGAGDRHGGRSVRGAGNVRAVHAGVPVRDCDGGRVRVRRAQRRGVARRRRRRH